MSTFEPGEIEIKGDKPSYETDVTTQLKAIAANPVGKLLLEVIGENSNRVRILPYTGGDCNATARPDNPADAAPDRGSLKLYGGYPDGAQVDAKGKIVVTTRDDPATYKGTGKGSSSTIRYSPETYLSSACVNGKYGSQPDEVLFHELVHGYRHQVGRYHPIPAHNRLYGYWTEEEWLAILITNIYISAKTKDNKNLRKDHDGHKELEPPLNTSDGFLRDPDQLRLVEKYVGQEVEWFTKLARIPAAYNPIAEEVSNPYKYNRR